MPTSTQSPPASSLDTSKLEGAKHRGDKVVASCPACREAGADKKGEHLFVNADGKFGCVANPGLDGKAHRQRIFAIVGKPSEPKPSRDKREVVKAYDYTDEKGDLLFQVCRTKDKAFPQRRPDGRWSIEGVKRVLYRLPELRGALTRRETIYIVEGEKDADRLHREGLVATCNPGGAGKWKSEYTEALDGADAVILPDNDQPGKDHAFAVADRLLTKASRVRVVYLPDLPPKGDVSDWLDAGGTVEKLERLVESAPDHKPGAEAKAEPSEKERKPSQADILVELAGDAELFHSDGEAYATVKAQEHLETHRVKTKPFRRWLASHFYHLHKKSPSAQAMQDALETIAGKAVFDGEERPVHTRIAGDDTEIFIDLCDSRWRIVRVNAMVREVIEAKDAPVRFVRKPGMMALPEPGHGNIKTLREFVNIPSDDAWVLLVAWLVACFRPSGPYPVLSVTGEQGSAKSGLCRVLRGLVDPSACTLRSAPRDERDLMIAATNGWVVALDNLSNMPAWLSDSLCRLSTGGGFSTRELYSDDAEKLFSAQRPVLLNGITQIANRSDLLDRVVSVHLEPIPEAKRMPERDLWAKFDAGRPAIFGAILDLVMTAIDKLPEVDLDSLPRMADFAEWAVAAESGCGWKPATFMQAYMGARAEANSSAIEASPIGGAVVSFIEETGSWTGTAGELLSALNNEREDGAKPPKGWPESPRAVTSALARISPNLRAVGIEYRPPAPSGKNRKRVLQLEWVCKTSPASSASSAQNSGLPGSPHSDAENVDSGPDKGADDVPRGADDVPVQADDVGEKDRPRSTPHSKAVEASSGTRADDVNGHLRTHSKTDLRDRKKGKI